MSARYPEVIALSSTTDLTPPGRSYAVSLLPVDTKNPFRNELEKVSDRVERSLTAEKEVSLLARAETGLVAVATLIEQPELSEVITLWAAFKNGLDDFGREGVAWLEENRGYLTPALLDKVTTVYTSEVSGFHDRLDGARIRLFDFNTQDWKEGLNELWRQPVDVYFGKKPR